MKTDKLLLLFLASAILFLISSGLAAAEFEGSGSASDPYLINNAADFDAIRNDLNAHYKLNNNIDFTGFGGFLPIGDLTTPFSGSLTGGTDGSDWYTISNFYYSSPSVREIGLFGYAEDAEFSNLVLENIEVTGAYSAGALVGRIENTTITKCDVNNSILIAGESGLVGFANNSTISDCIASNVNHTGNDSVGGILGLGNNTSITNCHSEGKVEAKQVVGGIVGGFVYSTIESSTSSCDVNVNTTYFTTPDSSQYIGGLAGLVEFSDVNNSHASGSVESVGNHSGGLIGRGTSSNITYCHALGNVNHTGYYAGGLIGSIQGGNITDCYAEGNVNSSSYVGGLVGYPSLVNLTNSYTNGSVVNGSSYVGGLIGTSANSNLMDCYVNNSTVNGSSYVGGLAGYPNTVNLTGSYINNSTVNGSSYVGGLAGYPYRGDLTGSYVNNSTIKGMYYVGGLAGYVRENPILECFVVGNSNVTGQGDVGGLAGVAYLNDISDSYVAGTTVVNGAYDNIGGLVGRVTQSTINGSFMAGDVVGSISDSFYVGGLAGTADSSSEIFDCYVTGDVKGNTYVGGLLGSRSYTVRNCLALNEFVNGTTSVGRLYGRSDIEATTDSYAWVNMTNGGTAFADGGNNGTTLTSADVWRIYPDSGWENWGSSSSWDLNQYRDFLLPVHAWTDKNIAADATHLIPTYFVIYDGNTHTSGTVPVDPKTVPVDPDTIPGYPNDVGFKTATILGAGDMEKEDHTFTGWNTEADGSGDSYAADDTRVMNSNITLYAQWTENIHLAKYYVTYDGNTYTSGTVPVDLTAYDVNFKTATILGAGDMEKEDHTFTGWNTEADGSGDSYVADDTRVMNSNVTLYAQWTENTSNPGGGGGGDGNNSTVTISGDGPTSTVPGSNTVGLPSDPATGFTDSGVAHARLIVLLFMIAVAVFSFRRVIEEQDAGDERFTRFSPVFG